MDRKCRKCGLIEPGYGVAFLHAHHIIPKFLGGTDKDGRILLCKPCHDELHKRLGGVCRDFTKVWIGGKHEFTIKTTEREV